MQGAQLGCVLCIASSVAAGTRAASTAVLWLTSGLTLTSSRCTPSASSTSRSRPNHSNEPYATRRYIHSTSVSTAHVRGRSGQVAHLARLHAAAQRTTRLRHNLPDARLEAVGPRVLPQALPGHRRTRVDRE